MTEMSVRPRTIRAGNRSCAIDQDRAPQNHPRNHHQWPRICPGMRGSRGERQLGRATTSSPVDLTGVLSTSCRRGGAPSSVIRVLDVRRARTVSWSLLAARRASRREVGGSRGPAGRRNGDRVAERGENSSAAIRLGCRCGGAELYGQPGGAV